MCSINEVDVRFTYKVQLKISRTAEHKQSKCHMNWLGEQYSSQMGMLNSALVYGGLRTLT